MFLPHANAAANVKSAPKHAVPAKATPAAKTALHSSKTKVAAGNRPSTRSTATLKLAGGHGVSSERGRGRKFAAARSRFICNYPIDRSGETQHGIAVYYGVGRTVGRMTANGERFDPAAMTAASPTLPLDSEADVRNLRTGQTLRVRINDRGPYGPGLLLDVTPAAAEQLGLRASGRDQVEILPVKETLD